MLLSFEPLVCFKSSTNGKNYLKIISGGFRLIQSAYDGLWHDGKLILYVRLQIPYVCGNHELSCGAYDAVDMYVSYYLIFVLFTKGVQS